MRFQLYLQEKYIGSYTQEAEYFDENRLGIYVNPTQDDMKMFRLNGMRFVADPFKKNLYVWDEEVEIHARMMAYLMKKGLMPNKDKSMSGPFLTGYCQVEGSKMIITDTFMKDISGDEWKWLDKYFSNRKEFRS